jgi:1-acyl-sn-glycerol-3-phosphate acyltransferase
MRTAFLAFVFVPLTLAAAPLLVFCVLFGLRDLFLSYGRWMMRVGRIILGIGVEALGLDRLDRGTPCVFMSNHQSFLDGPLLMTVLDRPARVIVKRFVFRVPVLGLGMRFAGYVPLDKEGAGAGRISIATAAGLIRDRGYSFLIFPEGTRSWDGKMLPLRRGGFFLALQAGTPVVPVTIMGTHELMPRGTWRIRRGRIAIIFHDQVPTTGLSLDDLPDLMEKVRQAIFSPFSS